MIKYKKSITQAVQIYSLIIIKNIIKEYLKQRNLYKKIRT